MDIYSRLSEIHFLCDAQLAKHHLRQTKQVSLFITADKDTIRKKSSLGKHHRIGFVLIISIIFHVQDTKSWKAVQKCWPNH